MRSTRRRQDAPELPRLPMEDRTIGRVFTAPDGKTYRPSMFLTLTLPSYGRVNAEGVPVDPEHYDYRRAALDALHFPKLVDRFWQNLRRCAGYEVQYFATVEAQRRLAPHLHAAIRGTIPRTIVRQVRAATYHQLWWPEHELPLYTKPPPSLVARGRRLRRLGGLAAADLGGSARLRGRRHGRRASVHAAFRAPPHRRAADHLRADRASRPHPRACG